MLEVSDRQTATEVDVLGVAVEAQAEDLEAHHVEAAAGHLATEEGDAVVSHDALKNLEEDLVGAVDDACQED